MGVKQFTSFEGLRRADPGCRGFHLHDESYVDEKSNRKHVAFNDRGLQTWLEKEKSAQNATSHYLGHTPDHANARQQNCSTERKIGGNLLFHVSYASGVCAERHTYPLAYVTDGKPSVF
jgi:hypothetical protein